MDLCKHYFAYLALVKNNYRKLWWYYVWYTLFFFNLIFSACCLLIFQFACFFCFCTYIVLKLMLIFPLLSLCILGNLILQWITLFSLSLSIIILLKHGLFVFCFLFFFFFFSLIKSLLSVSVNDVLSINNV